MLNIKAEGINLDYIKEIIEKAKHLNNELIGTQKKVAELETTCEQLQSQLAEKESVFQAELSQRENALNEKLKSQQLSSNQNLNQLREDNEALQKQLTDKYEADLRNLTDNHEQLLAELEEKLDVMTHKNTAVFNRIRGIEK